MEDKVDLTAEKIRPVPYLQCNIVACFSIEMVVCNGKRID